MRDDLRDDGATVIDNGERGAALIIALLVLALLLALTMGISLTAISEMGVSNTYGTQTIALQAAEAGLNHAAGLVMNYTPAANSTNPGFTDLLLLRPGSGGPGSENANPLASTDYLSDIYNPFTYNPPSNNPLGYFTPGAEMIFNEDPNRGYQLRSAKIDPATGQPALVPGAFYRVSLIDDEPSSWPAIPRVPNFNPVVGFRETVGSPVGSDWNNKPNVDLNNRLVIYSTGTYANASVTLEGWIAFLPFPALSANDNITVSGNTTVSGIYGGIHSNEDLLIDNGGGNNWQVEQTFTASGQILPTAADAAGHVGGFYGGNQARLDLPAFVTTDPLSAGGPNTPPRLQDFLIRRADTVLIDPDFAHGAHATDPNDTSGDATGNKATRRLASLAERLGIGYTTLAEQLDSDPSDTTPPKVQQASAAAVAITRATLGGAVTNVTRFATLADTGWSYSPGANASWGILTNNNGMEAAGNTYYVVGVDNYKDGPTGANPSTFNGGNVVLTGNVGSNGAPLQVSILATGSITVGGTPNMTADLTNLVSPLLPPFDQPHILLAAIEDIKINGDNNSAIAFTGVSYAGEQVELSGSGDINGQVIAFSNAHVAGSPVGYNSISGSFDLMLNQGNSIGNIRLFSWRQIKR